MKGNFNSKSVIAIVLIVIFLGSYVISFFNNKKISDGNDGTENSVVKKDNDDNGVPYYSLDDSGNTSGQIIEPKFIKQGELNFLGQQNRNIIKKIDIEVADSDQKREQGLMYRKSMSDENGMLFIFDTPEPKNFWMHNTYISLDIIYVSENRQIVTIARKCKTLNDENIPSGKDAQYVIEVNGGWCDKFGVKEGDFVSF